MLVFFAGTYHSVIGQSVSGNFENSDMQQMMQHKAMEVQQQMFSDAVMPDGDGLLECCRTQQQLPSSVISSTISGLQKGTAITLQTNDIQHIAELVPLEKNNNLAKAPPGDADVALSSVIKIE